MNEIELALDLLDIDESLPQYQKDLIKHLELFKFTLGLRSILARHRFGPEECARIKGFMSRDFELKKSAREDAS